MRRRATSKAHVFGSRAAFLLLTATVASAQPRFRITDLGTLSAQGNQNSEAYGINNAGQVVGDASTAVAGVRQAFRWDNTNGVQPLGTLEGGNVSIANDINEAGQVAGTSERLVAGNVVERACLWLPVPIGPLNAGPNDLGTLDVPDPPDPNYLTSQAFGINDAVPFQVVGRSETLDVCNFPVTFDRAFVWDVASMGMSELVPAVPATDTRALAINTPQGTDPIIAGYDLLCTQQKVGETDPIAWQDTTGVVLPQPPGFGSIDGEGRGVNDAGQLVGWAVDASNEDRQRALYWSDLVTEVNLHTASGMPTGEESIANGINNADVNSLIQVVGKNETTEAALLWESSTPASQWVATDLNDEIAPACGWFLREAHDVNDSGWIVGSGTHDGHTRAFLLTPRSPCPGDVDGDCFVGVLDLLLVLGEQGPCPVGFICTSDANCDCTRDVQDVLLVLAYYDQTCPCESQGLQGEGSSNPELESVAVMMGFASLHAYVEWLPKASESEAFTSLEVMATLLLGQ